MRLLNLAALASGLLLVPGTLSAEQVRVRYLEGVTHGFLVLRTMDNEIVADGDLEQVAKGGRVTADVKFRFKDGSFYEETTVFTQRGVFKLVSDRVVRKGPSFKGDTESFLEAATGTVTVRSMEKGKEKVTKKRLALPPDVANGLVFTLLKNVAPGPGQVTVSMVAASDKPRVVKLHISSQSEKTFSVGKLSVKANEYVVKVEIGGVAGAVAPLVGKQPPDTHVWIAKAAAPTFIASEGPLYEDGPIWRIELTAPAY